MDLPPDLLTFCFGSPELCRCLLTFVIQMHLPQESQKARVGADRIEEPVALDRHHPLIAFVDCPIELHENAASISPRPRWIHAKLVGGTYPFAALLRRRIQGLYLMKKATLDAFE
ncbi:MAG TPA: hypothetical protein VLD59_06850, partial [Steroidobacteraceae bacterium]|nr:hypothetical protein [Steroidobacteraceae bacterium]